MSEFFLARLFLTYKLHDLKIELQRRVLPMFQRAFYDLEFGQLGHISRSDLLPKRFFL